MVAYGFAIFTGAFLLFLVQPLMGKYLLPWFGGAPGVWTTCMLFFQVVLLGGYAYAHFSSRWLRLRGQVVLHVVLVLVALATLPITPGEGWKPSGGGDPTLRIIALLAMSLGLPYFALAATAPLLQHWFSRAHPGVSPFRLYALSNAGSLLALLSYPIGFETWLTRGAQTSLWGVGLGIYALACAWCGWQTWGAKQAERARTAPAADTSPRPGAAQRILWGLLPACGSVLLLAITNKICQDVAAVAFLWVLPLTVYLLTFIICFDRPQWYRRGWFGVGLAVALVAVTSILTERWAASVPLQILVYLVALFVCCMVCHGEVYHLKPAPEYLTSFYLLIAAGGALGGFVVAVVAPVIFTDYFELHWGLLLCGGLFLVCAVRERKPGPVRPWPDAAWAAAAIGLAGLGNMLWAHANQHADDRLMRVRNFYGVLKVFKYEYSDPTFNLVELVHGHVAHGMQFLHPGRDTLPTLYYSTNSGVGRAFRVLAENEGRVGVIGLGTGTLAAYGRPGDHFRFYEINPEVEDVARAYFTYLTNSPSKTTVILGDARLSMEAETPQNFDLLVLDAFNSDSVPVHLLTREAFEVYERHLKTNGVIAVHISNRSLDLEPVVNGLARAFQYEAVVIKHREPKENWWVLPSTWTLLSREPERLKSPTILEADRPAGAPLDAPLWTDDFSGLFRILRWQDFFAQARPQAATEFVARSAATLTGQGEFATQIALFREEVARNPNSAAALNNLACLLAIAPDATLRNGAEAVQLAEKACALTEQRNPVLLTTLAAAYAEAGRFAEAVAAGEKARALAIEQGQSALAERNEQLLELYRKGQPYHQADSEQP